MAIIHGNKCVALDCQNICTNIYPDFFYDGPFAGQQFFRSFSGQALAFLALGLNRPTSTISTGGHSYTTSNTIPLIIANYWPVSGSKVTAPTKWQQQIGVADNDIELAIEAAIAQLNGFNVIFALGEVFYDLVGPGITVAALVQAAGI